MWAFWIVGHAVGAGPVMLGRAWDRYMLLRTSFLPRVRHAYAHAHAHAAILGRGRPTHREANDRDAVQLGAARVRSQIRWGCRSDRDGTYELIVAVRLLSRNAPSEEACFKSFEAIRLLPVDASLADVLWLELSFSAAVHQQGFRAHLVSQELQWCPRSFLLTFWRHLKVEPFDVHVKSQCEGVQTHRHDVDHQMSQHGWRKVCRRSG